MPQFGIKVSSHIDMFMWIQINHVSLYSFTIRLHLNVDQTTYTHYQYPVAINTSNPILLHPSIILNSHQSSINRLLSDFVAPVYLEIFTRNATVPFWCRLRRPVWPRHPPTRACAGESCVREIEWNRTIRTCMPHCSTVSSGPI